MTHGDVDAEEIVVVPVRIEDAAESAPDTDELELEAVLERGLSSTHSPWVSLSDKGDDSDPVAASDSVTMDELSSTVAF